MNDADDEAVGAFWSYEDEQIWKTHNSRKPEQSCVVMGCWILMFVMFLMIALIVVGSVIA